MLWFYLIGNQIVVLYLISFEHVNLEMDIANQIINKF